MRKIERANEREGRGGRGVWGRFVVMATDQYTTDDIYYIQLLNTYFIDFLFTLQYTDCKTELVIMLRKKIPNSLTNTHVGVINGLTSPTQFSFYFIFLLHHNLNRT